MIKKEEVIHLKVENATDAQIQQIQNIQGVISLTENNQDILPNQKQLCLELKNVDQLPLIFEYLFKNKIKLVNFKRDEPTLEDAFIELTGKRSQ
jgi:ABC-type uncharacterized transport system ATPase subunit